MDDVISNFIQSRQYGITMQFKGMNSTLHYKCEYTKPTSIDVVPRRRSRHSSPVILPQIYSNLDTFLHNMEMVSLPREDTISSILINGQNETFKYKNSIVLTALIPVYNLDASLNSLVTDTLSIFDVSIKYLFKTSTTETQFITRQKKSLSNLLKTLSDPVYSIIHQTPDIRYKRITILNTTYINVTVGFSFYTEFTCIPKILRKIIYKYDYNLISIRHNEVDYINQVNKDLQTYIKNKLAVISDTILFSQPTKCLKTGGIEYQKARLAYYNSRNQFPPEISFDAEQPKRHVQKKRFGFIKTKVKRKIPF